MKKIQFNNRWWSVVGACFGATVSYGTAYAFPVFLVKIREEFEEESRGLSSWINSVSFSMAATMNVIAGVLSDGNQTIYLGSIGVTFSMLSLILSSFSSKIWQLFITHGFFFGISISFCFMPTLSLVSKLFQQSRRRSIANGIGSSGSGLGNLIFPLIAHSMLSKFTWRNAMRLWLIFPFSFAIFLLFIPSLPITDQLQPQDKSSSSISNSEENSNENSKIESKKNIFSSFIAKLKILIKNFSQLIKLRSFQLLFFGKMFAYIGFIVPYVHIVPYSTDIGLSSLETSIQLSMLGVSGVVGRLVLGLLADTKVGVLSSYRLCYFGMAISLFLWTLCKNMWSVLIFSICYGLFAGAFIGLVPSLCGEFFGAKSVASATGTLYGSGMIGMLLGAPIVGYLFDYTKSYLSGSLLTGGMVTIGFVLIMFVRAPLTLKYTFSVGENEQETDLNQKMEDEKDDKT